MSRPNLASRLLRAITGRVPRVDRYKGVVERMRREEDALARRSLANPAAPFPEATPLERPRE